MVLEQVSVVTLSEKMDYLQLQVGNKQCLQPVEGLCLQAMRIVHHHANSRFDWLISGHQSIISLAEATSMLSGKYKDLRLSVLW